MRYHLSEALQMFHDSDPAHGIAMLVELHKALLQTALGGGDWSTSTLLLPTEDPLSKTVFGGESCELRNIYNYKKSLRELRSRADVDVEDAPEEAG